MVQPTPASTAPAHRDWSRRWTGSGDDLGLWLLADVGGQIMVGLWLRVGQCRGGVVVLQVGAGLPLPVLPQMLLPARDAEQFDEQSRVLAVLVEAPVGCAGPQP